ncbi:hypothetical protein [Rhodopirellula sp. MGV]|uniref:hypothetical protein n=1 Tax=Rhodopirellula sp. MGV TaxID=2023130 RepID=UPI000B973F94|nr:hypothetical protein [Rhodopirellula sp. MGV]OYP37724.1 hypothetical protein CGZ80_04375 [Rhodopirellula sp. MGV]PNY37162.1 hypothetical protein C2E31_09230 [Rhodopirellula baltica]
MKQRKLKTAIIVALAAGPLAMTGCTSPTTREDVKLAKFFSTPQWMTKAPWSKKGDEPPKPYPNPAKLAATWTSDVLVQGGKTPTRGFGGRIFFFDEKSKSVPVEGTLTVHGFEIGAVGKDTAIRPYKFTPEQFTRHFSQSDFGASYSVWIPWDPVGGNEKRVSLVATFQTKEGKVVQGAPTTIVLPGNKAENTMTDSSLVYSPDYRRHRDAIDNHATRPTGLVTTTIHRNQSNLDNGLASPIEPSIRKRIQAFASENQALAANGQTPAIDIPMQQRQPRIMAASAEMPNDAVNASQVRQAAPAVTAPRRLQIEP